MCSASRQQMLTDCRAMASLSRVERLASDPAGGVGGGEAGIAAGVVDDFGDLVVGKPVVACDLHVELEFIGCAQSYEDAERDEAAVASAQPLAGPQPAEDV